MSQRHKVPPNGVTVIYLGLNFSKSPKGDSFGVFSIMYWFAWKKKKISFKEQGDKQPAVI